MKMKKQKKMKIMMGKIEEDPGQLPGFTAGRSFKCSGKLSGS